MLISIRKYIAGDCLLKEEFMMSVSTAASSHRKPAPAWTSSKSFRVQGHLSIKIQFVLFLKERKKQQQQQHTLRIETSGTTLVKHNTKIYNSKSAFISPIKTIKYIM